jgi:hypothetical protein
MKVVARDKRVWPVERRLRRKAESTDEDGDGWDVDARLVRGCVHIPGAERTMYAARDVCRTYTTPKEAHAAQEKEDGHERDEYGGDDACILVSGHHPVDV